MLRKRIFAGYALAVLALAVTACGQTETATDQAPAAVEDTASGERPDATEGPAIEPFCEEIGRRVSQADCDALNQLADGAQAGVAAFNAPDPMKRGERHTLQLAIGHAPTPEEIAERERLAREAAAERLAAREAEAQSAEAASVASQSGGDDTRAAPPPPTPSETVDPLEGETVEYQPLVGRFMRAELTGAGFNIAALSPASQEVLPDSVTTWTWDVIAQQGGQRALTLTTVVEGCTAEGQCYPLRSTSRNYAVNVTVGWLGRAEDFLTAAPNWLKLLAGVLAALAALIAAGFGVRNALRQGRSGGGA